MSGLLAALFTACAVPAFGQSSITGVISDTGGAKLPGVSVEAESRALDDGARTAVTDTSGRYQLDALRPGRYRVTASLPGFSSVTREDVVLTEGRSVSVDAILPVASGNQTIYVSQPDNRLSFFLIALGLIASAGALAVWVVRSQG